MYKTIQIIALLLVSGLASASPAVATSAMELKTADREVPGTREVEAGNFTDGITRLERALVRATHARDRAAVLVNLCVAHAATGDLSKATKYCDAAISNGSNVALAYNNRAIVNFLQGDIAASINDLERAAQIRPGIRVIHRNLDRARNISRVQISSIES